MPLFGGITLPGRPDPENIRALDVLPLPQIHRMMATGIAIDREYLWDLSSRLESRKTTLKQEIASCASFANLEQFVSDSDDQLTLNPDSSPQISRLLFDILKVGSGDKLKMTKGGTRVSAGKKQLEALKRRHPVIPLILEYREASKLRSMIATIVEAGVRCGDVWSIHGDIVTTRTDTGRLAMRRPNLQNVPARSELGRELRLGFIARPGKLLISVDFSQIELRLLAHAANDANMLHIFMGGGDIHTDTAMRAFGLPLDQIDPLLHRAPCKNVNFGVGYGLGPPGLYDLMALTFATAKKELPEWVTLDWCEKFIEQWFDLYPQCRAYFDLQHYRAQRYGIVWTEFGRVRRVPEVFSCHQRIIQAGLRQAGNMPIQGMAADVFKLAMARVETQLVQWRRAGVYVEALLPVHDELLIECDAEWAEDIKDVVIYQFQQAIDGHCRCPILADGKIMERWKKQ